MDGPNGIYARYKADNTKPGSDFHEQFGTEEEVKDRLRWRAVRLQGFTSEDKMHAFIMQKYAVALYKGAFLKQDGSMLMAAEEEDTMNNNERANRILFTELIRDLGFKIKYPQKAGDSPVPAANAIYKKLMA